MKIFIGFLIVVLMLSLGVLGYLFVEKTEEYDQIISLLKDKQQMSNLILNTKYDFKYDFVEDKGEVFLSYELVSEKIDESITLSNSGTRVYISLENIEFNLETVELTEYVKNSLSEINIPLRIIDDKKYLNIEILEKLYNIEYKYFENEKILYLNTKKEKSKYKLLEDKQVYFLEGDLLINSYDLNKDEEVILLQEIKIDNLKYLVIMSETGKLGLVEDINLKLIEEVIKDEEILLNYPREKKELDKVNLIWDSISSYNDSKNFEILDYNGLNVISPTWFNLNVDGIVINSASLKYGEIAHEKNYQVWGLYKNNFDPDWTTELLNTEEYVDKSIAQIVFYSTLYNLDGINIDFEDIYLKDKEKLADYVAKMRKYTNMQNLYLSIDAVVPGGSDRYSKVIDRERIAKDVDYFMLMAYDEHWGSAPTSGSVASIPWVIKGIEGTLKTVPKEKLVLGVPLYMRVWMEENNRKVGSKAYAIKNIGSYLEDLDYTVVYDEKSGQNYIETKYKDQVIKIWLEDKESLEKRIELINQYNLSGIAGWRLGYQEEYYWELIDMYMDR